ncbi:hypothetical protein ABD75_11455 [Bacillus vallismortis]|nr:hypothetical protein [Bacillus vallismortis]QAV07360.1 hypothetical protein BV11031_01395 [Bacillus vallismortis]
MKAYLVIISRRSSNDESKRKTEPFRNGAVASNFLKGFFWELENHLGLLDYSKDEEKIKKMNLLV